MAMEIQMHQPKSLYPLARIIWEQNYAGHLCWQILPSGCLELIFNLGEKMDHVQGEKVNDTFNPTENFCFLSGLHTKPLYLEFSNFHVMGIQLEPIAAMCLFGIPCSELQDWAIPGEEIIQHIHTIEDQLRSLPNFNSRVHWLESALLKRLFEHEDLKEAIQIQHVVHIASARKQEGTPIRLESLTGYSRMHTFRLFKNWLGLSPSKSLALNQFTGAIKAMHQHSVPLTRIGLQMGYFDQPHFIRNFKAHAQMTPGQYRSQMSFLPGQLAF